MHIAALILVPFAFTMSGFVFSGLLEPMAAALDVTVAVVGTIQAAFAIACAVAGPVLARVTMHLPRRGLLLGSLAVLALLNLASGLVSDFELLFALRLLAGGLGALAVPLAMTIAAALATPKKRPGAIAAVYSGIALGMMLGVPLGSIVGAETGWQASFLLAAGVCGLAFLTTSALVPAPTAAPALAPSTSASPDSARAPAKGLDGRVIGYLCVTFLAFSTMFALVGFIGPVIGTATGMGAVAIAPFQILSGVGCLLGLGIGARMARAPSGARLPALFVGMGLSLVVLIQPLATGAGGVHGIGAMLLSVIIGPAALFATAPIVQTRLAETAGEAVTFAFALNGSMVYLGQGAGVALGAASLGVAGLPGAPIAGALLAVPGAALALALARKRREGGAHP